MDPTHHESYRRKAERRHTIKPKKNLKKKTKKQRIDNEK